MQSLRLQNTPILCHFCRHCHLNVRSYVGKKINNYIPTRYLINYFYIHISSMKTCGSCGIVAEVYIRTMGTSGSHCSVFVFVSFTLPPGVTHGRELDFRATLLYHTTFLPLTHLLLATREAQFSSAHSRPIAKDFVDGKRSFYNNFDIRLSCSRSA